MNCYWLIVCVSPNPYCQVLTHKVLVPGGRTFRRWSGLDWGLMMAQQDYRKRRKGSLSTCTYCGKATWGTEKGTVYKPGRGPALHRTCPQQYLDHWLPNSRPTGNTFLFSWPSLWYFLFNFCFMLGHSWFWRRKWQSTTVLLLGKSHGLRSLVRYSQWGHKESDTTEATKTMKHSWFTILC